jgi:hypothetical protein
MDRLGDSGLAAQVAQGQVKGFNKAIQDLRGAMKRLWQPER